MCESVENYLIKQASLKYETLAPLVFDVDIDSCTKLFGPADKSQIVTSELHSRALFYLMQSERIKGSLQDKFQDVLLPIIKEHVVSAEQNPTRLLFASLHNFIWILLHDGGESAE